MFDVLHRFLAPEIDLQKTCLCTVAPCLLLFGSKDREEHVEGNLDAIDKDKAVLGGDELEVDGVHNRPHLPRSLTGREKIVLELCSDLRKRISVDQAKVGEEDSHENGAPDELIDGNLGEYGLGIGSLNLAVQPIIKVVSRRPMVEKAKGGKSDETLPVERASADEKLWLTGNSNVK